MVPRWTEILWLCYRWHLDCGNVTCGGQIAAPTIAVQASAKVETLLKGDRKPIQR